MLHMQADHGSVPPGLDLIPGTVRADHIGGFALELSDTYVLAVFPASSIDEYWRLIDCRSRTHFVVEPHAVYCIGESVPVWFNATD
jgi:hypothetical protein